MKWARPEDTLINTLIRICAYAGPAFLVCSVSLTAWSNNKHDHHLETIVVTASGTELNDVVQPVKVLSSEDLMYSSGSTLGEVLNTLPGISNSSFGSGVGRPVVRGLSGNRVKIAINGSDAADVSAMSSDHAPMAEASNAQQVEVLYGPATLLFGSGAIGGVINLSDDRFHEFPLIDAQGNNITSGDVALSVDSASAKRELKGKLDVGLNNWALHLDGFTRFTGDFESADGVVANTDTQNHGINMGASYIYDTGFTGLGLSLLDYQYGVPNEHDERAMVQPSRVRLDWVNKTQLPFELLESVKTQIAFNDYEHNETHDDEVVGYFEKENFELKTIFLLSDGFDYENKLGIHLSAENLALCHSHSGCAGVPDYAADAWDGSKGTGFNERTGSDGVTYEFAHDTPMPKTETLDLAAFWLMSRAWQYGQHELALRIDQRTISADPNSIRVSSRQDSDYYDDKTFLLGAISAGWNWLLDDKKYGISLGRSQRAPQADELFWNGDHHATFSYQLDNPDLEEETAHTLDLTLQMTIADMQMDMAAYYYDYSGFIYNDLKAVFDPIHGNAVYRHEQKDAYLTGFELAASRALTQGWYANFSVDHAVGRLKAGDHRALPRIPPISLLAGVDKRWNQYLVKADVQYFAKQSQVAENESITRDYHTLNLMLAYERELGDHHVDVIVKVDNVFNTLGRNHVSYLKELSPVMGRNVTMNISFKY